MTLLLYHIRPCFSIIYALNHTANQNAPATSAMDELRKLKELLDMGIVTQEEFDAKKKQLLGL